MQVSNPENKGHRGDGTLLAYIGRTIAVHRQQPFTGARTVGTITMEFEIDRAAGDRIDFVLGVTLEEVEAKTAGDFKSKEFCWNL